MVVIHELFNTRMNARNETLMIQLIHIFPIIQLILSHDFYIMDPSEYHVHRHITISLLNWIVAKDRLSFTKKINYS